jgi:hypothetical protein
MSEIKQELDETQRKAGRGRAQETPVIVHNVLFIGIGAFVGVVVLIVLLIYYLA